MLDELVKCSNCEAILTQCEYRAMIEAKETEWCCYECTGEQDEELTSYGKFKLLEKFVKEIANVSPERTILQLSDQAKKLLLGCRTL
jgi:dihydroneopterin aldolase